MTCTSQDCVVALVATRDRPDLLNTRALPSIAQQSQTPIRVVVVDDSDDADAKRTQEIVRDWRRRGTRIEYLRNRRTKKRAAGAWNTGLDHLLRTCDDPSRLFVAILDDDDEWAPNHLRRCLAAAGTRRLDVVAAGFRRIEEDAEPALATPPESLEASSFLVGNPGIQGSNLVCRLRVLLEAGLFDESLRSCTDRDLCIRLAELPGVSYGRVAEPTVRHFACASRARLSTPGSAAKKEGLDQFHRKWRCHMSDAVRAAFSARARDLFGWAAPVWKLPDIAPADGNAPSSAAPKQAPPHLIVGTIANPGQLEDVAGLLADLRKQVDDPELSGHDVLILENGNCRKPDAALRNLVEGHRAAGLRVHLVDRARHLEDAARDLVADGGVSKGKRLPIAPARTVLQSYLYAFAKGRPGAVVWIVDDDMRLDPLVAKDDGRLLRRPQRLAPMVRELRRLHAGGRLDIAIGTNSGAPPLPFAATVRVQLVDLVASLQWLALLEPQAALPDRSLDNAVLRANQRDYYYDLSRKETDRLETPFVVTPAFPGESAGDTFTRLASAAERILAGEQVFRPLAIAAGIDPLASMERGLQRGGNTFVFDVEALRLAPNPSPTIAGRPSRRSDMIWTLLQERYFGRRVVTLPIALHHDRSHVAPGELDVERIVDDMRLDPLVAKDDGRLLRRPQRLAPMVRELRRLHAGGRLDIAIGTNSGAPPLPFAATVRVQLVDLVASLQWLALLEPQAALPDRSLDNAVLRANQRDYYYDLSRKETDRLETPFVVTPAFPGESAGDTFTRLASAAERILAGEQVFRPLAIAAGIDPLASMERGLQRGGNTFVFDVEALRLAPNPSPTIAGRPSRRSDMIWTLLQERYFGRRVVTLPIALHHDRSHVAPGELDVERIVDDVRGYALFSALKDVQGIFTVSDDQHLDLAPAEVEQFTRRVSKYVEERLAAFRLSFHRIRGLKCVLRRLVEDGRKWWRAEQYDQAKTRLRVFCNRLDRCYRLDILNRIERGARALQPRQISEFLAQLPSEISAHRNRLSEYPALAAGIQHERTANAKAIASTLAAPAAPLTVLGCGMEGVALSDGKQVFKVFDYWWKSSSNVSAPAYLRTLVGKWNDAKCLYPIVDFQQDGHRAVLVYPFEPSAPYSGGHGPGMVEFLAECWRHGVVCRNIHPNNLRVVDGRVRLIDYGSDIRPFVADEFVTMCQRAWLSYRWANQPKLAQIMRRALKDDGIPELDGFDRFHEAVRRVTGQHETPDVVFDWATEGGRVLDYGCGYGKLASKIAERGGEVMGYDPDETLMSRWTRVANGMGNLQFTHNRAEVLEAGRFDLVICARVLCNILDDGDFRTVLDDLRSLVTERGKVIVTVCDPHFTFGGLQAAEAERTLPRDADYEHPFVWRKKVRATGRVRCDVHRSERALRRAFARAGLAVYRRVEIPTVDLQRFEPAAEQLVFELRPVAPLAEVSLLIKACAMDADALDVQIRHLVSQLEEPRAFAERILVVDSKEHRFLRQHTAGSQRDLLDVARRLLATGWLDRIVEAPGEGDATAALNRRWFALDTPHTHTAAGAHVAPLLAGFEACATRYALHVDADIMVGRLDRHHDYLHDMLAVMRGNPQALTVAFNIAQQQARPYTAEHDAKPWRTESRAGLVDLARLRAALPLPNSLEAGRLALSWHRSLDVAIQGTSRGKPSAGRSYRGGDHRTFYIHPPNERKRDAAAWFAVLDRIEHGVVPPAQQGEVEWTGTVADWMLPRRPEPYVFIVSGRNVPAGRLRRCIASLVRQKGLPWGAVVFDDASAPMFAEPFEMAWRDLAQRCTIVRNRRRQGLLANMVTAIRTICTDPNTVIVTLDADDALIGDEVLLRLAAEYENGADVTVGSMLRTDKAADYPVRFDRPREHRGGTVWQHLRSFRKRLFDAIPDDALRLDGEYIDLANDWAYMLPIVEMAKNPVHIADALYLHEPSGIGKDAAGSAGRKQRDEVIARIVAKAPAAQRLQTRAGTL